MTGLTVFLQNGEYVFGKSWRRGLTGCSSGHCNHRQSSKDEAHHNLASRNQDFYFYLFGQLYIQRRRFDSPKEPVAQTLRNSVIFWRTLNPVALRAKFNPIVKSSI